jgi:hypothetical protein
MVLMHASLPNKFPVYTAHAFFRMSIASRQAVPFGYRAAFFVLDFVFPLGGIFGHLFAPGASKSFLLYILKPLFN